MTCSWCTDDSFRPSLRKDSEYILMSFSAEASVGLISKVYITSELPEIDMHIQQRQSPREGITWKERR